jgi:FkbM family methyltransferase
MQVPGFIRRVTDPLLGGVRVPVLSGVNRGRWWSLISAGSGYGSGRRAGAQMAVLAALVRPGDVVWDVGAHHGFVTLCAARRAGPGGAVHAFEPSARNRALLERHVRWNRLGNVTVHPFALSAYDGASRFGGTGTSKMYALGGGPEMVQVRRAATLVAAGICAPPTFMKLDVEGAEADALAGALDVLPQSARLLIAVHNREADARCTTLLRAAGFELAASHALERCRRGAWRSDPDLFCLGPEAAGRERDVMMLRAADY